MEVNFRFRVGKVLQIVKRLLFFFLLQLLFLISLISM